MTTQTTLAADQPKVIETLGELWQRVGIRAMAQPRIERAGAALGHALLHGLVALRGMPQAHAAQAKSWEGAL